MISHELATWHHLGFFARRRRRCGGAATPTPTSPEARPGGMYSKSAPDRTVEPLEALEIDPVVGPGGEFALRPRPKTPMVTRSSQKVAAGLAAVRSLFSSALEYQARVPGQRGAALELYYAGIARPAELYPGFRFPRRDRGTSP